MNEIEIDFSINTISTLWQIALVDSLEFEVVDEEKKCINNSYAQNTRMFLPDARRILEKA